MRRVGQNRTFIGIYGVHTVFLAGKFPYIQSCTVQMYGSGQPYICSCTHGRTHTRTHTYIHAEMQKKGVNAAQDEALEKEVDELMQQQKRMVRVKMKPKAFRCEIGRASCRERVFRSV